MTPPLSHLLPQNRQILLKDFAGASFAQFLARLHFTKKQPVAVISDDVSSAERLMDELSFFSPEAKCAVLPPFDVSSYAGLSPLRQTLITTQRIKHELISGILDFVVIPKKALLRRCLDRNIFVSLSVTVIKNDLMDREAFLADLQNMGYERYSVVEEPGQFAVRGDIIDVFSPQYPTPHRLSLFDIEVEDIREFVPHTQRTGKTCGEITIIPAHEIFLKFYNTRKQLAASEPDQKLPDWINKNWQTELKQRADKCAILKTKRDQIEEFIANRIYFHGIEFFLPLFYGPTGTLFEYLRPQTLIVTNLPEPLDTMAGAWLVDLEKRRAESDHIATIFEPHELFLDPNQVASQLERFQILSVNLPATASHLSTETQLPILSGKTEPGLVFGTQLSAQITKIHSLAPLASALNEQRLAGIACHIVCANPVQRDRLTDLLRRFELPLSVVNPETQNDVIKATVLTTEPGRLIQVFVGKLHEGFYAPTAYQWWLTDEDIFGKKTQRAVSRPVETTVFSSFAELTPGDFIVHLDHGVGIYQGLVKLDLDPNGNDFVLIEYLGGDKLYVPADKLSRLQRFAAHDGAAPQLDKLGSASWAKTRAKAKRGARKLAKELLEIQARRATLVGNAFNANTEAMEEFAASFPFDETPDQLRAIQDVLAEMEKQRPMDRLVCGDVGYGKTEVALRAVYKAVLDGRQVAVLVPTTVLAFQHHKTFVERFKNYPVNVALLSRFRSAEEQKGIVQQLSRGEIDVVVGTHRLLSKDIVFSNLGLLIVDEEHRFGVIHKEKIKKLKAMVGVLTLTATPIPRTLNFSLNGIRDLSIINTPPVDRLAIRTHTCYFDEVTIRDAIMKELRRSGQVFFVHNRVQSIAKIATQIVALVPEARVRFAHGQMAEEHLEDVMIAFMNHEFDVLVCTTIIESGLDIPNANTMIINRADMLGLAQLYQLRGRVGRSDRQAYCYLIVPPENLQTRQAQRRLSVIQRFTELGSGFRIASHDLEIRGAGNILGDEQSGHIASIGYDLYIHLLNEAIHALKNKHIPEDFEPELSLSLPARIPDTYVPDEQLRLVLYRQMSACRDSTEVDLLEEEWADRFGTVPEPVQNLGQLIRIRILCQKTLVSQIRQSGDTLFFSFHPEHQIETRFFANAIQKDPKKYAITRDGRFSVRQAFATHQDLTGFVLGFLKEITNLAA